MATPRVTFAIRADIHTALMELAASRSTSFARLVEDACIQHYSLPLEATAMRAYIRDPKLSAEVQANNKRAYNRGRYATIVQGRPPLTEEQKAERHNARNMRRHNDLMAVVDQVRADLGLQARED